MGTGIGRNRICSFLTAGLALAALWWIVAVPQGTRAETFQAELRVNDNPNPARQQDPSLAVAPNGTILVAWEDDRNGNLDIYLSWSADGGLTWGDALPDTDVRVDDDAGGATQSDPSVAVGPDGSVCVVWRDWRSGNADAYFARSTDGGRSFASNVRVDDATGTTWVETPQVQVASDGTIYVAWVDYRNGLPDIYFTKSADDGLTFGDGALNGNDVKINDDTTDAAQFEPGLVADGGMVYVAWRDDRSGNWDIRLSNSTDGGATFGDGLPDTDGIVNDDPGFADQFNPTVAARGGVLLVAWADYRAGSGDIRFSSSVDGGATFGDGLANNNDVLANDDTGGAAQETPSIAVDPDGLLSVVWADLRDGAFDFNIYHANSTDGGASFGDGLQNNNDDLVVTGPPSTNQTAPVVALTASFAVAAWTDTRNDFGDIYFSRAARGPGPVDTTPPEIRNVLVDEVSSLVTAPCVTPAVTLNASVEDLGTGNSLILNASWSAGPTNATGGAMAASDGDGFNEVSEGVTASIDVSTWSVGNYTLHVYAADAAGNGNYSGSAFAFLRVADLCGPAVSMQLNGAPSVTVSVGTPVTITAVVDDTASLGSMAVSAEYQIDASGWMPMASATPPPGDSPVESFTSSPPIDTSGFALGAHAVCVRGWDARGNNGTSCATLTVGAETVPPAVLDSRINGLTNAVFVLSSAPPSFTLTAVVDDTLTGGAFVGGANFTEGIRAWPGTAMGALDGGFDEVSETVTATVATPGAMGAYDYCVYGWDAWANTNTTGACARLSVVAESEPPAILAVEMEGTGAFTVRHSTLPSAVTLTAIIDDTAHGNSSIGGANFTWGAANWTSSTVMTATDGAFDEVNESTTAAVPTPTRPGNHAFCVYGWDEWDNGNSTGACATLTVVDDSLPQITAAASPAVARPGESVNFSGTTTDLGGIAAVHVVLFDEAGRELFNDSAMATYSPATGRFHHIRTIQDPGEYAFAVWVQDSAGNWNLTRGTFTVREEPPASTLLLWVVAFIVVVILAVLVALLYRRRKKRGEVAAPTSPPLM